MQRRTLLTSTGPMAQFTESNRTDSHESPPNMVMRILYNETLLVAVTLLLSLSAVVALAVFLRFDDWGLNLFRILVITVFTILPAIMYYVFIASRKRSLFQEFVSNLSRLGLLDRQCADDLQSDDVSNRYFARTRQPIEQFSRSFGHLCLTTQLSFFDHSNQLDASQCRLCTQEILEP